MASKKKDDVSIGMKQAGKFLQKRQTAFLILIPLIVCLSLHLYAAGLPAIDRMAEENVNAYYRSTGSENLIGTSQAKEKIKEVSDQYKSAFRDDNGNTYIYGVDSYTYLRRTNHVLEGGEARSFLPWLEANTYKLASAFNSNATLMGTAFWLPTIFSLLTIVLVFFTARKLTNNMGGFLASFLLAVHPQYFTATQAGFVDTNFLNLFLSALIVFLFFEGIGMKNKGKSLKDKARNNIRQIICLLLIMPVTLLFRFTWSGWYYIIFIIILFAVLYAAYELYWKIKEKGSRKYYVVAVILTVIVIGVFSIADDTKSVRSEVDRVKKKLGMLEETGNFPSALSTTTELFSAKERMEVAQPGKSALLYVLNGSILAALALLSLLMMIYHHRKPGKKTKYAVFTSLWFLMMLFVGWKSIRFLSFFGLPFVILISYGSTHLLNFADKKLKPRIPVKHSFAILTIILLVIISASLSPAIQERTARTPLMTSPVEKASRDILENATGDFIVNLWWHNGYLYEYYLDDDVLINNAAGGSGNPRLYWTARALTSNETEAIRIFRMLDCGKRSRSPEINLSQDFCKNPQKGYLVLDNDMIGKMDVFRYYTNWDFNAEEHEDFSLPKIPSISQPSRCSQDKEQRIMKCGKNFVLDMKSGELEYKGQQFPVIIVGQDSIFESNQTGPYTLLVYPETGAYKAVLMRTELTDSVFARLYFMNGIGVEKFKLLSDVSDPVGGRVVTYIKQWE